jgi:recombination associated protein RdgC
VVNQIAKERAAEIEEQQGFKPGRKQMKELKEQVTDELLPRAFNVRSSTHVWIDPVNGWLCIDSASPSRADDILKMLLRSIDELPVQALRVKQSPVSAMTSWLATDDAPAGFSIDQDTELRSSGDSHATVRYANQAPEADDLRRHIAGGKQCTRLALTWNDRISFVLTESLALKRIAALDVLKESADGTAAGDDERFDADMLLMTGELSRMLADLVQTLGGESVEQVDWVQKSASGTESSEAPTTFGEPDDLYEQAVAIVRQQRRASISLVQRHLHIGYNRAARLMDQMEAQGAVGPMQSNGDREVLGVPA